MSLNVFRSRAAKLAVAAAFTVVAAACGSSSPTAPATAVIAAPGNQSATYTASTSGSAAQIPATAAVTPIPIDGGGQTNYTCAQLATLYGSGAQWFQVKFDVPLDGMPNGLQVKDGMLTANITNGTATSFNWTSNVAVDAVFVKSGQGHNLYLYGSESTGDTGLTTPSAYNYQDISHISFCYDVELLVSKTASTTFTRDYDWTITKSVDQPVVTVADGGSATVNYSVAVTKDAGIDSNWAVSGNMTVTNPHPSIAASGVSVTDNLPEYGAVTVSCPSSTLAPLASMTCSYGPVSLASGAARTNTAAATSTTFGIARGTGSADVAFITPTTVLDNAVSVTDTFAGAGLPGAPIAASQTFAYARTLGASSFAACGTATTFGNTASIATDDGVNRSSSASVTATLTCPPPPPPPPTATGCTLTQGYWGTHSIHDGPKKYNATWAQIGENTPFYQSGTTFYGVLQLPTKGNAYYTLAHQFIAAKLNVLSGAAAPAGVDMGAIDTFFTTYTPAQIGAMKGSATVRSQALAWAATLDTYNNGLLNVSHCGS